MNMNMNVDLDMFCVKRLKKLFSFGLIAEFPELGLTFFVGYFIISTNLQADSRRFFLNTFFENVCVTTSLYFVIHGLRQESRVSVSPFLL